MIHAYNIMTNKGDYKRERFFQLARERGDPELHTGLKMYKKRARKSVRRNFFSQRVINPWNLEKREVVQKEKTSGFMKSFDDEEKIRRIAREGRDERLYKLLFREDNLRSRVFTYFHQINGIIFSAFTKKVDWHETWASTGLWC